MAPRRNHGLGQVGEAWMEVATATSGEIHYPSDGIGGTTTTAASSLVAGKRVLVTGYLITNWTASNARINIKDGDGNNVQTFTVPGSAATANGVFFPTGADSLEQWDGTLGLGGNWTTARVDYIVFFKYWPSL